MSLINHEYDDDRYIKEAFKKIALNVESEMRICLYGCGVRTIHLLESLEKEDNNIFKRIDKIIATEKVGEQICGKQIVSIDQVSILEHQIIIIIARYAVVNTICRKLEKLVNSGKIEVYDLTGKNLIRSDKHNIDIHDYDSEEEMNVARLFNNEMNERKDDKWVIKNAYHLASSVIAPIVFKYLIWLIQRIQFDGIELVLFPSRDGFLLNRIYQNIRNNRPDFKLPDSVYFYTSRRSTLIAAARNKFDVKHIAELPGKGSASERLSKRLGIEIKDVFDENSIPNYVSDRVLKKCKMERNLYLKYIEQKGLLEEKKYALADFVAVGSVHEALQRLSGKNYKGYYFLRRYPDSSFTRDLEIESLYGTYGDFEMNFNLYRYYYFLENVMSSYEPTFMKVGDNGEIVFFEESRSDTMIELLRIMHDAICDYCMRLFALCSNPMKWDASVDLYDRILGFFSEEATIIPDSILNEFVNVDEFLEKLVTDCNR